MRLKQFYVISLFKINSSVLVVCRVLLIILLFKLYTQLIERGIATFLTSGMLNGTNYTKKIFVKRSGTQTTGGGGIKKLPSLRVTTR